MNATLHPQIIRSVQKRFAAVFTSARVIYAGQKEDRGRLSEWVEFHISGPEWVPSRSGKRYGRLSVDVNVFARQAVNAHRADELVGLVVAALDREAIEVLAYPDTSATPASVGWVRLQEAKVVPVGAGLFGSGEIPVNQINVSFDGSVEI